MGIFRQFPYSNFHEMNMDEILKITHDLENSWAEYHSEWDSWKDMILKALKNYITPDMFSGESDAEKLQAAINYSIANGYPGIYINREYDLTGSTLYINKGTTVTDEISPYSRNKLIFMGDGLAKLKKTDSGYMFRASILSGDISFVNIKFIGHSSSDMPEDCVAMKVFDCANLIRLTNINCTFTWCGNVYYQNDIPSKSAQSIVSIANLYAKNNIVAEMQNLYDGRFIGDTIEDGVSFFKSEYTVNNVIRALHVSNCCIEGMSNTAIDITNPTYGTIISENYFEANYNHISIPRYFEGMIFGNIFFGRGYLSPSLNIYCMQITPPDDGYCVTGNISLETNPNTTLIQFDTTSPYYSNKRKIFGGNFIASGGTLTNVPDNVINSTDISTALSTFLKSDTQDLTSAVTDTYSSITGGSITYVEQNGFKIIEINNLAVNAAIVSGSYQGSLSLLKPTDNITHNGVLANNSSGVSGTMFLNTSGAFGLRLPSAGTYSGQLIFR